MDVVEGRYLAWWTRKFGPVGAKVVSVYTHQFDLKEVPVCAVPDTGDKSPLALAKVSEILTADDIEDLLRWINYER